MQPENNAPVEDWTHGRDDELTGLRTYAVLREHLEITTSLVRRYDRGTALLVIDLDRFRRINEALGHEAGDDVLREIAMRLQMAMRDSDVVCRRGEDEYLVLLTEISDDETRRKPPEEAIFELQRRALDVADRLRRLISADLELRGRLLSVTASIGISVFPGDAGDGSDMVAHAEAAMYSAKELGGDRCQLYSIELQQKQQWRLTLETQLPNALRQGQFRLLYQPIVHLASRSLVGVEALLRWTHPELGPIPANEFLSVADESGFIVTLGAWVTDRSLEALKQWKAQGLDIFLNLNLSDRQLRQPGLAREILAQVATAGAQTSDLLLDITEESYSAEERTRQNLQELGEGGVMLAVDGFGSGLSSLMTLKLANTHILKLDRSIVAEVPHDRKSMSVCVGVIQMANGLNMRSLAKGIETEEQLRYLTGNACDMGQGFLFSGPVEAAMVADLYRAGTPGHGILGQAL
ncbi:MAG: bifunctional diguanylate cyclase/phosphodiesterase [Armatimonadetes bacterium]|nr:bifunctional diguanylate cyclase/phosphodiesterase [Armatimonadota bacterium]